MDLGQGRRVTAQPQGGVDEEGFLLAGDQYGISVGVGALALAE